MTNTNIFSCYILHFQAGAPKIVTIQTHSPITNRHVVSHQLPNDTSKTDSHTHPVCVQFRATISHRPLAKGDAISQSTRVIIIIIEARAPNGPPQANTTRGISISCNLQKFELN